jgi:pilus assembly protein CpaF
MDFFKETVKVFLKPIEEYLLDSQVSEIMVNGYSTIYVEKKGKIHKTESHFDSEDQLWAAVRNVAQFVGRTIDEINPILDARLPDGSRVHVVIPPCAKKGVYFSIRKFAKEDLSIKNLIDNATLTLPMAKFLNTCVLLKKNIMISGGTSSGKTTLLNVFSSFVPSNERIVVIEDSTELQLQQDHVLPMETKSANFEGKGQVTLRDLVKTSLRMRPDRIIIGEVRGGEALDLVQALNTGHTGSMTTIHANSPKLSLSRLETLALMSEVEVPWRALRIQIVSAINIVVQISRLKDGSRKIVAISEVLDLDEQGNFATQDIFTFEIKKTDEKGTIYGTHQTTGNIPTFVKEAKAQGYKIDEATFKK